MYIHSWSCKNVIAVGGGGYGMAMPWLYIGKCGNGNDDHNNSTDMKWISSSQALFHHYISTHFLDKERKRFPC